MTDDRVEGRYEQLEEVSDQLAEIAKELQEIVDRLSRSERDLRDAWPDRVGTEFADEVDDTTKTLVGIVDELEEKSKMSKEKSEQLRAVHE